MPTFRSDVVGSLLRPDSLKEARAALEAGRMTPAAFKQAEDRAVDEAIALQENAGLSVVTDGELRRYAFFGHLVEALEGFDKFGGWAIPFHNEQGEQIVFKRPVVVEKLRWRHSMCAEEWVYLRARTKKAGKVTLISAQQAAAYYDPDKSKAAYPTRDAYLADVVDLTRREVEELIRLGCACIEMDNAVIRDQPGVTFALHVCRGNNRSMFYASGGYEPIARVFRNSHFQRFLLE